MNSTTTVQAQLPQVPHSLPNPSATVCRTTAHSAFDELTAERFDGIDAELEIHIEDCQWQYLTAYERFQIHGNQADRDEALLHLHRMNTAIKARSPAVQAALHAQAVRDLDERCNYFGTRAAQDMEARA